MNTSQQFWIPRNLPDRLKVALSIPGKPPKTREEYRSRLWAFLEKEAEELDDLNGQGSAARAAYLMVPDQALFLEGENAKPMEVVNVLMYSDLMTSTIPEESLGPSIKNPDLQERAREIQFVERLESLSVT